MRKSVIRGRNGFTLIEMAFVILIIGILMAPAIGLYNIYQTNQRIERTEFSLKKASDAVGAFLAAYGRYPCPAPTTAGPGSLDYGFENCSAPTGITAVASANTALTPNRVFIGSLPFKTLNLQESEMLDGYQNRLTYGVTEVLTDQNTYAANLGGISLIDNAGNPALISPTGTQAYASFVIVTHGDNGDGAVEYTGNVLGNCANAPALDVENCNNDNVFRTAAISDDSDDTITYTTGIGERPWQYQDNSKINIHLKAGSQSLIGGDTNLTNENFPINADANPIGLELREGLGIDMNAEGVLVTQSRVDRFTGLDSTDNGAVVTDNVCDASSGNCFNPRIIGGETGLPDPSAPAPIGAPFPQSRFGKTSIDDPTTADSIEGGNIYCDQGVLVGITNGQAVCADEVTLACPPGQFISGVDNNGRISCSTPLIGACAATTITSFCGNQVSIPAAADGARAAAYDGTCHRLNLSRFDLNTARAQPTLAAAQAYLDGLNSEASNRTAQPCNSPNDSLIRDTMLCEDGSFDTSTRRTRKRGNFNASWPGAGSSSNANNSGPAYNPAAPMSIDPNNNATNHDCYCREDYTTWEQPCASGGTQFHFGRYRCANTGDYNGNNNIEYLGNSGNAFCNCAAGPFTQPGQQCHQHYGLPNNEGVVGTVINRLRRQCPSFNVTADTPPHDTSGCTCPARADQLPRAETDCPEGTGNSFVFEGITYTNKSYVEHRRWNCPTGVNGNVSSANERGRYTTTSTTQQCVCVDGAPGTVTGSCGPGQTGTPPVIQTRLNCATGQYENTNIYDSVGTCRSCSWRPPASSPEGNDPTMPAFSAYSTCNCNTETVPRRCRASSGDYWGSCQCEPL